MTSISYTTPHPVAYYTIIILPPFNFSVCRPRGGEMKLLCETEQGQRYLVLHIHRSITSSFNMSKTEHAGPHKGKDTMSIRHDRNPGVCLSLFLFLSLCLCTFLCVCVCVHLIRFQEHLVRGFEMQVSTRRKVCLYERRRMFSPMLPGTLNDFFFSLSGRSWEERAQPQSYKPKGQNETRCDKLLNSCHSLLHPLWCFRSPLAEKKNSLQQPSFYNLGESLTTAISHDKVFN